MGEYIKDPGKIDTSSVKVKSLNELCVVCTQKIEVMCFKGTGVCSEQCRKFAEGEAD